MDDLSICKRIAEIEGIHTSSMTSYKRYKKVRDVLVDDGFEEYNPLTDDALCFQLMIKYRVEVDYDICRVSTWYAKYQAQPVLDLTFKSKVGGLINSIELNRAICLVIIEANKDV